MADIQSYTLRIDGPLLRRQRSLLLRMLSAAHERLVLDDECELLEGVGELLGAIADQAHDRHGIDCLEPEDAGRCECEEPGFFCSGVPGILAHTEDGRLVPGAKVERCDLCQRYPSDASALEKLRELGYVSP